MITDSTFLEILKLLGAGSKKYVSKETMILEHLRRVTKRKHLKLTEATATLYQRNAYAWNQCFWRLYDGKYVDAFGQKSVRITALGRKRLKELASGERSKT